MKAIKPFNGERGHDRRYIDPVMVAMVERVAVVEAKQHAADVSLTIAHQAIEKRLEGMNEFRDQLKDQASTFVTQKQHDSVIEDIKILREAKALMEGKASVSQVNIAIVVAFLAFVTSAMNLVIKFIK